MTLPQTPPFSDVENARLRFVGFAYGFFLQVENSESPYGVRVSMSDMLTIGKINRDTLLVVFGLVDGLDDGHADGFVRVLWTEVHTAARVCFELRDVVW